MGTPEMKGSRVAVIIPTLNEEQSIGRVLENIPGGRVEWVVVVDGGSRDHTVSRAREKGAIVLQGETRGYGDACLVGLKFLRSLRPHIVVFLDGDYSDFPEELPLLIDPVLKNEADFVLGSRLSGHRGPGSIPPHAVWGNKLACLLVRVLYGRAFTDLGPFRAIRYDCLMELKMRDQTYGWTAEMQVKAVKAGLRVLEVPVSYRKRIGVSKISGSLMPSLKAGVKILGTILRWR